MDNSNSFASRALVFLAIAGGLVLGFWAALDTGGSRSEDAPAPGPSSTTAVATSGDGSPTPLENPVPAGGRFPYVSTGPYGRVHMSWLQQTADGTNAVFVSALDLLQQTWSAPEMVAEADGIFANWADFPSVVALADGSRIAHWLEYIGEGTYAYGVKLKGSGAGGAHDAAMWGPPWQPHDDSNPVEHGFVSLVPEADGGFTAIWLDGQSFADDITPNEMSVRARRYGGNGAPGNEDVLDLRACDCCQTGAALIGDALVVAYRDRSPDEIRDISVVRRTAEGWSEPTTVADDGWEIPGCPVNGPVVVATTGDSGAVGWFALVDGTPEVKVAFTRDAGATFDAPVLLERGSEEAATLGRVGMAALTDGSVAVAWLSQVGDVGELRYRRVSEEGEAGPVRVLATTGAARNSGFPRMTRSGDHVVLAWTDTTGEQPQVRTALVSAQALATAN